MLPRFSTFQSPRNPIFIVALIAAAILSGAVIGLGSYDFQGAFIVAPLIGIFVFLLFQRLRAIDGSQFFLYVLLFGLIAKLLASFVRLYVSFGIYSDGFSGGIGENIRGGFDAGRYNDVGRDIAYSVWNLDFDPIFSHLEFGTTFMELFTGIVYIFIGSTLIGGFLVFALISFMGSYFFYRAFLVAFPNSDKRLFALLIFFYPAILYWPNGIGKDAFMFFALGLASYGSALFLARGSLISLLPLGVGVGGALLVRPHFAGILVISLGAAALIRSLAKGAVRPVESILLILVTAFVGWIFLTLTASFLGFDTLSPSVAVDFIEGRQESTFGGGSAFKAPSITEPLGIPFAIITSLFRPFVWEATSSAQLMIQALDGAILLGLSIWKFKSLIRALSDAFSNPFIVYLFAFVVIGALAFTAISNFGTLARQRTMILPFFIMLIALLPAPSPIAEDDNSRNREHRPNHA